MSASPKIISEVNAIEEIVSVVQKSKQGEAPFAVIVGAGFSQGLVSTAYDFVHKSLPALDESFVREPFKPQSNSRTIYQIDEERRRQENHEKEQSQRRAISFWKRFNKENESCGLLVESNSRGLPIHYDEAYKCAFNERSVWPFSNRRDSHKFLHRIIKPDQPRLNAAHFFLASILGAQPNKSDNPPSKSSKSYFQHEGSFSRLILTTNFDPFLQLALQVAGRLYYMSDKPSLEPDDLIENQSNAIHLVYVHGSVHRKMANSLAEIDEIKERNANILSTELKRRAVIIIGYNGWDDGIVNALAACENYPNGLFWIDRAANPLRHFKPKALEILQKQDARYIVADAGQFMAKLNSRLVKGVSRFLDNPIEQVREKFAMINLEALDKVEIGVGAESGKGVSKILSSIVGKQATIKDAKKLALVGLNAAESVFAARCESVQSKSSAEQAWNKGQSEIAIFLCNIGLAISEPSFAEKANFLELRARSFIQEEKWDLALKDLTSVVDELTNIQADLKIKCLRLRASIWHQTREYKKAADDLTKIIKLRNGQDHDGQLDLYFWRACLWETRNEKGDVCRAITNYNYIIKSPFESPPNEKQRAYFGRAVNWYYIKQYDRAIADYTKVIDSLPKQYTNVETDPMKTQLVTMVARALCNRSDIYHKLGKKENALDDVNRVINNLVGVSEEEKAVAISIRNTLT